MMIGRLTHYLSNFLADDESMAADKTANNAWDVPTSLYIIAMIIVFQPSMMHETKGRSLAFWSVVLAISAAAPETSSIPILSTIISTGSIYPYIVVIPHSMAAAATYRSKKGDNTHFLKSFFFAFFLYGFGGSIVSDVLMGLPVTALSHARIIPCYVLGWTLVWFSPFDFVYKKYKSNSSALYYFLQACEAIDSVTTPMGRISRSARELPNKVSAPIVAGLFAGFGGAGLRYVVGESNSMEQLEAGFYKTLSYSLLWWWLAVRNCQDDTYDPFAGNITNDKERTSYEEYNNCKSYGGSNMLRVVIVSSHTCWTLLVLMGLVKGHPLTWLCRQIVGRIGRPIVRILRLGPTSTRNEEEPLPESRPVLKENDLNQALSYSGSVTLDRGNPAPQPAPPLMKPGPHGMFEGNDSREEPVGAPATSAAPSLASLRQRQSPSSLTRSVDASPLTTLPQKREAEKKFPRRKKSKKKD